MVTKHLLINTTVEKFVFLAGHFLEDWHVEEDYRMKQIVTELEWKLENVPSILKQDSFACKQQFMTTIRV